jgi:hypothetical protein
MNKSILTEYLLQSVTPYVRTIVSSESKQEIIDFYSISCENHPKTHFRILKKETIREVIARSNDERQTLLPLE